MKRIPAVLVLIAICLFFTPSARGVVIYHSVDQMLGTGPMAANLTNASFDGSTNTWTLSLSATNTGATPLTDVKLTLEFIFPIDSTGASAGPPFNYNGGVSDTWNNGTNTLQFTGTNLGPIGSLLTAQVSDYSNISSQTFGAFTKNWVASDPLPIISLGNFAASQTDNFTLKASVDSRYLYRFFGYFVAVPEPGTLTLCALGSLMLLVTGRRRLMAQRTA
jgi:hypothetical protein